MDRVKLDGRLREILGKPERIVASSVR